MKSMNILIFGIILLTLFIAACFIFKKIFRVILSFILIGILLTTIGGIFLYLDVRDYMENFQTENNLIILEENNNILTAISINIKNNELNILNDTTSLQPFFETRKQKELKKLGYFKAILIKTSFIEKNLPETIEGIPKQTYMSMLTEGEIPQYIAEPIPDEEQEKNIAMAGLGFAYILQNNPEALMQGLKDDDIQIHKQTILIYTLKQLPNSIVEFFF